MRSGSIVILLFAVIALSCSNKKNAKETVVVNVSTVAVIKKDLKLDDVYVADIQAVRNVEIRSSVQGYLETIYVDEGEHVKEGQLLFKLRDNEYRNEVLKAKAQLNVAGADKLQAEVEYERVKGLVDKKIVAPTELALATSKMKVAASRVEEATSNLEIANHRLSYTSIRAPFDGFIDRIPLKKGSLVSEGTLISSISDINSIYAYFNISENEYLKYRRMLVDDTATGQEIASLILSDGKEYDHRGRIEAVTSEFEENTGSIAIRARFPNPTHLLRHHATGKIKLSDHHEGALLVPQRSTFEIQDKTYVFVIDKNNVAHMRHFTPAGRTDQNYIVSSGLNEGEIIAWEGIQFLKEGMKVNPQRRAE
jgi:membrane fusion protein (multidrug efflux system)